MPEPPLKEYFLDSETATEQFGQRLADCWQALGQGLVIYLSGDLGSGKTTLSRGFLRGLGHTGAVKSPTYTLVEPYEISSKLIYHFDLYRLANAEELEYLGIRDYFLYDSLCLIEWPERGFPLLSEADLSIELVTEGTGRRVRLRGNTAKGEQCLALMRE